MKRFVHPLTFFSLLLFISANLFAQSPRLANEFVTGFSGAADKLSLQTDGTKMLAAYYDLNTVDILDIGMPESPQWIKRITPDLLPNETLVLADMHPSLDVMALVIERLDKPSRLEIRETTTERIIRQYEVGFKPQAVQFSESGRYLAVTTQGEEVFDAKTMTVNTTQKALIRLFDFSDGLRTQTTHRLLLDSQRASDVDFAFINHDQHILLLDRQSQQLTLVNSDLSATDAIPAKQIDGWLAQRQLTLSPNGFRKALPFAWDAGGKNKVAVKQIEGNWWLYYSRLGRIEVLTTAPATQPAESQQ